jgi:hypothetical protein
MSAIHKFFNKIFRFWTILKYYGLQFAFCTLMAGPALAHKASDAYLQILSNADSPTVSWQLSLALRDVDAVMDSLDQDNDRSLSWGEIQQNLPAIKSLIAGNLQVRCGNQTMPLNWTFQSLEQRSDGVYTRWGATSACGQSNVTLQYDLLKNVDATHRLLVSGSLQGQAVAAVVSPQNKPLLTLAAGPLSSKLDGPSKVNASMSAGFGHWIRSLSFPISFDVAHHVD